MHIEGEPDEEPDFSIDEKAEVVDRFLELARKLSNEYQDLPDEHILSAMLIAAAVCAKVLIACMDEPVTEKAAISELQKQLKIAFEGVDAKPIFGGLQ